MNLNHLSTEIYSVSKRKIFPCYTPCIMADVTEQPYLFCYSWTLVLCPWLWISDTCVHKSTDPLSVGVWVGMGVVKFHTMTLFMKVNCFPVHFLLRNAYW